MFQELKEIRLRKERLVQECESQRAAVEAETDYLQKQLAWVSVVRTVIVQAGPFLFLFAPLAGFALSKGLGAKLAAGGWGDRALGLVRVVNKARSYYSGFLAARDMVQAKFSELRAGRSV